MTVIYGTTDVDRELAPWAKQKGQLSDSTKMELFLSGLGRDKNVDFLVEIDLLNFVSPNVYVYTAKLISI